MIFCFQGENDGRNAKSGVGFGVGEGWWYIDLCLRESVNALARESL